MWMLLEYNYWAIIYSEQLEQIKNLIGGLINSIS